MIKKLKIIPFLIIMLVLNGISGNVRAQGWTFTFNLVVTGQCGAYVPYIAPFSVTYMPDRNTCESVRSSILSIKVSQPMYDGEGNFIGYCSAYYNASACTGSDATSDLAGVSINGLLEGNPFFAPHDTKALETWYNDFLIKLRSMGVDLNTDDFLTAREIPLTGEADFDGLYIKQMEMFTNADTKKSDNIIDNSNVVDLSGKEGIVDPDDLKNPSDGTGMTVQLLTTQEEQRKRDEWMEKNGFNDMVQAGPDNSIDADGSQPAGKSVGESILRTLIGQADGAAGIAGDFTLNVLDNTIEGIDNVVTNLKDGDFDAALGKAETLSETVAFNSAKKTALNYASSQTAEGGIGKMMFPLVSGSESAYKTSKKGFDYWVNRTGKSMFIEEKENDLKNKVFDVINQVQNQLKKQQK